MTESLKYKVGDRYYILEGSFILFEDPVITIREYTPLKVKIKRWVNNLFESKYPLNNR